MPESSFYPHKQPFLYLLGALVSGILADRFLQPLRWLFLSLTLIFIALSITFVFNKKALSATLCLLAGFVGIGALLAQAERLSMTQDRLLRLFTAGIITADEPVELTGVLIAPPEPAPDAYYLDLEAESVRALQNILPTSGRVRLMMSPADEEAAAEYEQLRLDYGSRVRILLRLERARTYRNPGSPDFNEFLERRGYDLKGTIKSPLLVELLGQAPSSRLLAALYHFRLRMMRAIDARFTQPVAGTLKAMLLGNRYFLDPETSDRLRESATFHTLVIAGLHIGIIALVLIRLPISFPGSISRSRRIYLALLRRFHVRVISPPGTEEKHYRRPSLWLVILSLVILWAYAVMVSLAPPVTRATTMISIGLIAPLLFRQSASVNSVALAAFLMLACKPSLISDAGFQLSFIAVAAIVTLAIPLIEKLRRTGEWRPSPNSPQPPACSKALKAFCEALFWDERSFRREMERAPVSYRLPKSRAAIILNRLRVQFLLRWMVLLLITSTAIQLATLPLMAFYFNRVAPVGILLNVLSGLLTSVIMLGSMMSMAVASSSSWLAAEGVLVVKGAHFLLVHAITPFSQFSFSTFRVAHYEGWQRLIYAAYFVPLGLLAWLIDTWQPLGRKQKAVGSRQESEAVENESSIEPKSVRCDLPAGNSLRPNATFSERSRLLIAYCLLLTLPLSLFAVARPPNRLPRGKLTVYFLDVGQGDSALIVFPHGSTMLIDGGGELSFGKNRQQPPEGGEAFESGFREAGFEVGEAVVSRFLWSKGVTQIDYALATHPDADHISGLSPVLKNFVVGEAIVGHLLPGNFEFDKFAIQAMHRQTPLAILNAGEVFELEGVKVEILNPPPVKQAKSNNNSVVVRLAYGSVSFLFTGDIEKDTEASLIESGANLRADVLKAPHHGSKTSSTEEFLDAVRPRFAVISVGERSRFGHPHREVVERYLQHEVNLLQTGRDGLITVQTDGSALDVQPYFRR